MEIGRLGVWVPTESFTARQAADFAARVEGWGYGALWIPEAAGRNGLVHAAWLLARTERLAIATGIVSIYGRDAMAMKAAQNTLAEQSDGRFLLGIGVSHARLVEGLRGHIYGKPLAAMRGYLDGMDQARYVAPLPRERPLRVLAALGPKMLALAAERADGAHTYNVTPEHTARARQILGPGKLLCVEQMVLAERDAAAARAVGRAVLKIYLGLPNYRNNWVSLGLTPADFEDGASDRLVDAMLAWGDEATIRARIQAHWDAGADHVCIQAIAPDAIPSPDQRLLERLAPG